MKVNRTLDCQVRNSWCTRELEIYTMDISSSLVNSPAGQMIYIKIRAPVLEKKNDTRQGHDFDWLKREPGSIPKLENWTTKVEGGKQVKMFDLQSYSNIRVLLLCPRSQVYGQKRAELSWEGIMVQRDKEVEIKKSPSAIIRMSDSFQSPVSHVGGRGS